MIGWSVEVTSTPEARRAPFIHLHWGRMLQCTHLLNCTVLRRDPCSPTNDCNEMKQQQLPHRHVAVAHQYQCRRPPSCFGCMQRSGKRLQKMPEIPAGKFCGFPQGETIDCTVDHLKLLCVYRCASTCCACACVNATGFESVHQFPIRVQ